MPVLSPRWDDSVVVWAEEVGQRATTGNHDATSLVSMVGWEVAMFADCYMYDNVNGFPDATYRVPPVICMRTLRAIAEAFYARVVFVEQTNGQAVQELPPDWRNECC